MSWGSLPRMANLVGPARTKRLAVLAETINATTAENWGWADYIAEDGKVMDQAMAIAAKLAGLPPVGVRMVKQGVDAAVKALNHSTSAMDMDQFALIQQSEDHREGIQSFLDKREAKFTGA